MAVRLSVDPFPGAGVRGSGGIARLLGKAVAIAAAVTAAGIEPVEAVGREMNNRQRFFQGRECCPQLLACRFLPLEEAADGMAEALP